MAEEQQTKTGLGKVLVENLWFPALFFFGFLLCYILPFHAPEPHDVQVAVASPPAATQIEAGLQESAPGAFDITAVKDSDEARQQVMDREASAAYATDGSGKATLFVAKGNGAMLQQTISSTFGPIAEKQGADLKTVDLAPTAKGDATGTGLFYLAMVWNIVPYISVMMLMRVMSMSRRAKLWTFAGAGAFLSVVGYYFGLALDIIPNEPLSMLFGFMLTQAVAWTVYGLVPFVKQYIVGVAITLFVLLSIPSSGGAVPHEMVPGFFRWLHPVMPLGNLIDALHGLFYFDGTGMLRPVLVLLAWMAGGAGLIGLGAWQQKRKQEQAAGSDGEEPQVASGAVEEAVEDPVFEAPVPHAVQPRTDDTTLDGRTPMLRGQVTEAGGAPLAGAIVTITDRRGHQLMHTRTDQEGRYAATGLPEDFVNVLLTSPNRLPSVARVLPTSGHPQRQDFVLSGRHHNRAGATAG